MKRKKKGVGSYGGGKESWFGDQFPKMIGLGFVSLASTVLVLFLAYQGLSRSVFFQVEEVEVKGCQRTTPKQILAWTGLDVQTNLWTVRTGSLKKKLENQDWIYRAAIEKDWPNQLSINIKERKARAMVSRETGLYYVDKRGDVFSEVLATDDYDYPVITGLEKTADANGQHKEQLKEALSFIGFAERGSAALPKQNISEIHLDSQGGVVIFMADRAFPISLGPGEMKKKYYRLSKVLNWLYRKKRFETATFIDMNYMAASVREGKRRSRVLVRFAE